MCVSCAWAKPAEPASLEFCENGAKATAWELTEQARGRRSSSPSTRLTELEAGSDHDLEVGGRLTAPMRWDAASDRYLEVGWDQAFAEIGAELKSCARSGSGRCSTPRAAPRSRPRTCTSCSRACTATTTCPTARTCATRARRWRLPKTIGVPVGTVWLDDFEHCRLHLLLRPERRRQQPAHAPSAAGRAQARRADRHLQPAARARARSHSPTRSRRATCCCRATRGSARNIMQVRAGRRHRGARRASCKHLIEADDDAQRARRARACSTPTSSPSTRTASKPSRQRCARRRWDDIERESGLRARRPRSGRRDLCAARTR